METAYRNGPVTEATGHQSLHKEASTWVSHTKGSPALVSGQESPVVTGSQFLLGSQPEQSETSCYRHIKKEVGLHFSHR